MTINEKARAKAFIEIAHIKPIHAIRMAKKDDYMYDFAELYYQAKLKLLGIADVSISLDRAKKYARHQHFLGTQGKDLVEFEDWQAKD